MHPYVLTDMNIMYTTKVDVSSSQKPCCMPVHVCRNCFRAQLAKEISTCIYTDPTHLAVPLHTSS